MSDLVSNSDTEEKEAPAKTDFTGAIHFAAIAVVSILTVLGLTWADLLGTKNEGKPKAQSAEKKEDDDTVADYEKDYLDGDISEDALDEHTVGLSG